MLSLKNELVCPFKGRYLACLCIRIYRNVYNSKADYGKRNKSGGIIHSRCIYYIFNFIVAWFMGMLEKKLSYFN